jgi:hypothetical protein
MTPTLREILQTRKIRDWKKRFKSWGISWPPEETWLEDLISESDNLYGKEENIDMLLGIIEEPYWMRPEESNKQKGLPPWIE